MLSDSQSTLWDLILNAPSTDDAHTIFAREPWERNSPAVLILTDEHGGVAKSIPQDFTYFLEIFICKQLVKDISDQSLSVAEQFERIVHYAKYDA